SYLTTLSHLMNPDPPPCISLLAFSKTHKTKPFSIYFFFNDTTTTDIYTLSLHDALPISVVAAQSVVAAHVPHHGQRPLAQCRPLDRKSTRLNSSHVKISYAVFCLKKKKKLYVNTMKVKAENVGFLHCIQLDPTLYDSTNDVGVRAENAVY